MLQQNAFHVRVLRGNALARSGEPCYAAVKVMAGSFKAVYRGNVIGWVLRGECLGTQAHIGPHVCDIVALELSTVEIIAPTAEELRLGALTQNIHLLNHMTLLRESSTVVRFAAFLRELSERFAAQGYSSSAFVLPMCRNDIASYLSMAPESVSRAIGTLNEGGITKIHLREVEILDMSRFKALTEVWATAA